MKADMPLSERQRLGAEDQRELRAAPISRHVEVLDQLHAVKAVQMGINIRSRAWRSMVARMRD